MSEKQERPGAARTAMIAWVAVGALVAGCAAPLPTELGDATEEAVDVQAREARDDTPARWADRFQDAHDTYLAKWFVSDPAPLVFVDDVRVGRYGDLPGSVRLWSESGLRREGLVDRVEVIGGPKSRELYGAEGAGGAILVFTKDRAAEGEAVETVARSAAESSRADPREGKFSRMAGPRPFSRPFPLLIIEGVRVIIHGDARDEVGMPRPWPAATPMPEDLRDIDRIEVIKGAAAATLYGRDAVGGAILIYLKK